ncbi:MAG TPA: MFS transporter [Dehalococcoidia bacterium]|nr:MFS transporter [Dehalococcoidia bacterium]
MNDPPLGSEADGRPLLADRRFLTLWLGQGLAQTAQNALLFSLLIVVLKITGSSTQTSILIFSFILPSLLLGLAVGVLLDRWRKIPVLVITNLLRCGACLLYLFFHEDILAIDFISVGFSATGLFFNPAVVALIPALVPRERLVNANSLYNFTVTGSQLLGMVFLAPLFLKSFGENGEEAVFIMGAAMFLASAAFCWLLSTFEVAEPMAPERPALRSIPAEFGEGWRPLLQDGRSMLALGQLIVSSSLVLLFAILIPRYMDDILHISPDNAAFVFAPTGIGALVGLRFLPWFSKRYGMERVVVIGLCGIALSLMGFVIVKPLASLLDVAPGPLNPERILGLSLLQALTMFFAGPLGFSYSFLNAPAQTILHERAPAEMRGRIFATQIVSANFLSLLPVLFIGALTDLLDQITSFPGITLVLLLLAIGVLIMAFVSQIMANRASSRPPPGPPERPQEVGVSFDRPSGLG